MQVVGERSHQRFHAPPTLRSKELSILLLTVPLTLESKLTLLYVTFFFLSICSQRRDLLAASGHSLSHLQLMFADYADLGVDYVEFVSVLPPPPPPLELLMNIQLCHTFTVRQLRACYLSINVNSDLTL